LAVLYIAQLNNGGGIYDAGAGISTTGNLTVGKSSYLSGLIEAPLSIGGTANIYGYSEILSTLTVGQANLYQQSSSSSGGVITGNAVFNDSSYNGNDGTVTGNATFNDLAVNREGATVSGNATFNDQSTNNGLVSGNAAVYYPVTRPLGGTVTGTITYSDYPDFYFNAAVDGTWDNHLNWWRDSSFSVAAGIIPTPGSTVYIEAHLTTGPTVAITLATLNVAQINNAVILGSSGAGISTTGDLNVGVGSSLYGRIDNASLTIGGAAYFYASGGNSSTLTVSLANFYDSSSNYGTGQGSSSNGIITGNAVFNDNSQNYCTVDGAATFNDNSANSGLVSGDASVYYPVTRPLGGTVTGTITYFGYPVFYTLYFNAASDHTWDNALNWWQDPGFKVQAVAIPANGDTAYIEANVTTGPSSAVTLAALYIAQINNGATLGNSGAGISTTGDLTVGSGIALYGRINSANLTIGGTAYFYGGNGGNSSTLTVSSAHFYLGSSNYGTSQGSTSNGVITGNAVFHDNAKNYCSIGGTATFNDISGNNSAGDITGNATFNDSSYNASGATVGGNATFTGNASNSGHVSGNASVYYPAPRPLGGTVTGTITYINYP
jgi:hypothetical protein